MISNLYAVWQYNSKLFRLHRSYNETTEREQPKLGREMIPLEINMTTPGKEMTPLEIDINYTGE